VIALTGGTSTLPLSAAEGEPPTLAADPAATLSMSQAARDVLRRIDGVLAENAQPLRKMIANLDTFAGALARNSDRLDGIVAGLERMTGGAAARARVVVYDLSVPAIPAGGLKPVPAQLVVPDPVALAALESEKIQSLSAAGVASALADAQWSDMLPKLVQVKLIRALEDAGLFAGVSRPLDGLNADVQLLLDIRKFQVAAVPAPAGEVEIAGKVLDDKGRIVATRIFRAVAPTEAEGTPAAAAALDRAFGRAAADLVPWAARTVGAQHEKADTPKPTPPRKATRG
jgi:phospholipid/cholesterol/gamma-HCH transport system substrate-binding protein